MSYIYIFSVQDKYLTFCLIYKQSKMATKNTYLDDVLECDTFYHVLTGHVILRQKNPDRTMMSLTCIM